MAELSEKLKGLKFMQGIPMGGRRECEVSFSTLFCTKGVFSFSTKQKIPEDPATQKKQRS
jgi:hypothetical protein